MIQRLLSFGLRSCIGTNANHVLLYLGSPTAVAAHPQPPLTCSEKNNVVIANSLTLPPMRSRSLSLSLSLSFSLSRTWASHHSCSRVAFTPMTTSSRPKTAAAEVVAVAAAAAA